MSPDVRTGTVRCEQLFFQVEINLLAIVAATSGWLVDHIT